MWLWSRPRCGGDLIGGHRIARPHRADLTRRLVAHGEDEIHHRRAGAGEFIPAFAAQPAGPKMQLFERSKGQLMSDTFADTAGAVAFEPALASMIDQHLGEDAARRIAGAEQQHIVSSRPSLARPTHGLRASTVAGAI
jgi:hypothetical protein